MKRVAAVVARWKQVTKGKTSTEIKKMKTTNSEIKEEELLIHRDITKENVVLFLQHVILYQDFWTVLYGGYLAHMEYMIDILAVFFPGVEKTKYAYEILEMKFD